MTNLLTNPLVSVLLLPLAAWLLRIAYRHYHRSLREAEALGREKVMEHVKDSFITDMATNHLPHLYDGMKLIAAKLDVELPDPPPIRFIPLDTEKK